MISRVEKGDVLGRTMYLLILHLTNFSNKTYHDTEENLFYAEHIGGLVIITLYHIMEKLRPKMGIPWQLPPLCFINILCLTNALKKFYHGTGENKLSARQKKITCECCLGEHCVSLWSSYSLKQGIP